MKRIGSEPRRIDIAEDKGSQGPDLAKSPDLSDDDFVEIGQPSTTAAALAAAPTEQPLLEFSNKTRISELGEQLSKLDTSKTGRDSLKYILEGSGFKVEHLQKRKMEDLEKLSRELKAQQEKHGRSIVNPQAAWSLASSYFGGQVTLEQALEMAQKNVRKAQENKKTLSMDLQDQMIVAKGGRPDSYAKVLRTIADGVADFDAFYFRGEKNYTKSPITFALEDSNQIMALALINAGANLLKQPGGRTTPLAFVLSKRLDSLVRAWIDQRPDFGDLSKEDAQALSRFALRTGRPDILDALNKKGKLYLNNADTEGKTLIHHAITHKQIAAVLHLIELGADVNRPDKQGNTPVHLAAALNEATTVQALIAARADLRPRNLDTAGGKTALAIAAEKGHSEIAKMLLKGGAYPNREDADGCTPLMLAAANGHEGIVDALLKGRADPKIARKNGSTALMMAAEKASEAVVRRLIEGGADVNQARVSDGVTALSLASQTGNMGALDALLEAGADIDHRTKKGNSPLILAAMADNRRVTERLLAAGADPNLVNNSGGTALIGAMFKRDTEGIQALLEAGANPTLYNQFSNMLEKTYNDGNITKKDLFGILCAVKPQFVDSTAGQLMRTNVGSTQLLLNLAHEVYVEKAKKEELPLDLLSALAKKGLGTKLGIPLAAVLGAPYMNPEIRKALASSGFFNDFRDQNGDTMLHRLVQREKPNLNFIKELIAEGADPYLKNKDGWNVVDWVMGNTEGGVELTPEQQADFMQVIHHASRPKEGTLLSGEPLASYGQLSAKLEMGKLDDSSLEKLQQMPKGQLDAYLSGQKRVLGQTLLHRAVARGDMESLGWLLAQGANPKLKDSAGWTPLHLARAMGNEQAAQSLLKKLPQLANEKDEVGRIPSQLGWNVYLDNVEEQLKNLQGADELSEDEDDQNRLQSFLTAAAHVQGFDPTGQDQEVVQKANRLKEAVGKYKDQWNPKLSDAVENVDARKISTYLSRGANPNLKNKLGEPLIQTVFGALQRNIEPSRVIESLAAFAQHNADINATNAQGRSVAHTIGQWGRLYTDPEYQQRVTEQLLKAIEILGPKGLRFDTPDMSWNTALSYARASGNERVLQAMQQYTRTKS